jgi:hypothetical protein
MKFWPIPTKTQPQGMSGPEIGAVTGVLPLSTRVWCLLGLLLIAAAGLRIYGADNDLWLDEIWSLRLVAKLTSPWQVFTGIHHDNNHYLNSLWLYLCGFRGNWPGYRLPALLAGVGSVVLAGVIARRRTARAGFFAIVLFAFSYVQILYSSEARGYSTAVFFSLLSFYALEKYLEKPGWRPALLLSLSSILGFASQLIFLNFFCAAVLWSGWRLWQSGRGAKHVLGGLLACHAAPAAFFIALYFVDLRRLVVGGGTRSGLAGPYADSLLWVLGHPAGHFLGPAGFVLAAGLLLAGIGLLWRDKSDLWIFFTGVILVFPILVALARHADFLYVRYFLIGMTFFLLLLSYVLARLDQHGRPGRLLCLLFLAGYFTFNGRHTLTLFQDGRGRSAEAVRFLAENTRGPVVTVGGDQDLRIGMVLQFYGAEAMGDKRLVYYRLGGWPPGGPEWVVCQKESFEDPVPPGLRTTDATGDHFEYVKTFPAAPLSGLHWFVYHNLAGPGANSPADRLP